MRACTDAVTGVRGGFVLLEAVVALAIVALISLGVLGATAMQVRTADKAAVLLIADALAQERLMTLRALGYDELVRLPDSLAAGTFAPPFDAYSWRAEVEAADGEYELFTVAVAVFAADESFTLRTLLHEPQPTGVVAPAPTVFEPNRIETRR
jgi:type II secretory pathway pseudopilin PulG